MRYLSLPLCALCIATGASAASQERRAHRLADPQATIEPADVAAGEAELADPDPLVRAAALDAIAARVGLIRFAAGPRVDVAADPVLEGLRALQPGITAALQDADERVRVAAVQALVAVGQGGTGRAPTLDRATQQTLRDAFATEPSPIVRATMIRLATQATPADASVHRQLLTAALDAPEREVVQTAIRAAGRDRVAGPPLAKLAVLLEDGDLEVRRAAARALAQYGAAARPHLATIRRVRAADADPITRDALAPLTATPPVPTAAKEPTR